MAAAVSAMGEESAMRIRVKFTKTGPLKFIGHLDVMRYFQKAIRRAEIPAALSAGFSPHMIMSFAQPLGVGKTSSGEYFDLDLKDGAAFDRDDFLCRLNARMAEGISCVNAVEIPSDKKNKGMSQVMAASYIVSFRKGRVKWPGQDLSPLVTSFMAQENVMVLRKTKKSEEETDIRPWIMDFRAVTLTPAQIADHPQNAEADPQAFAMLVSAKSGQNLKPELLIQTFAANAGLEIPDSAVLVHRLDLYADIDDGSGTALVPLDQMYRERSSSCAYYTAEIQKF